jgi:hypothetical protein
MTVTDPKVYKVNGIYFHMGLLACVLSFAVVSMIIFMYAHHWIVKAVTLVLCPSAIYYLRYLLQNSEIEISIAPEGIIYTGIRKSGLKMKKYQDRLRWDEIKNIHIEQPEKGPIKIQTTHGSLPFWNAEDPDVNTEIIRELNKYMRTEKKLAEQPNKPDMG